MLAVPDVKAASSEAKDPFRGRGSDTMRLVGRAGKPMFDESSSGKRCRKSIFLISPRVFLFDLNKEASWLRFGASLGGMVRDLMADLFNSDFLRIIFCSVVPWIGVSTGEDGLRGSVG